MGKTRYNHDANSLGESVGFDRDQQKEIIKCFNDSLNEFDEDEAAKSAILERTITLAIQRGLLKDHEDFFFAAFFLSEFITRRLVESDNDEEGPRVAKTLKAIASQFAKQMRKRGIELDDLPLDDMINEVKGDMEDFDSGNTADLRDPDDLSKLMSMDTGDIINKKKLVAHMESDTNDF